MDKGRRDLLSGLTSAGAIAALASWSDTPRVAAQSVTSQDDHATYDFWNSGIRDPDAGLTRSLHSTAVPRAVCIYYDKTRGFVAGSDIGDAGLPDKGDLNVIVNVDHIRPSVADQARFVNLEAGSLRIDMQQSVPMPSLAERLAWTAIASFLPDDRKLPALKDMTFDPGSTWGKLQTIPLPCGGGRWTWNFFLQHRKSKWIQLFESLRSSQGLLLPIFGIGLPAIAITALNTVDKIVAGLTKDSATEWLFQSSDTFIYGTKESRDSFEGSKLRLRQGTYVILPADQLAAFAKQQSKLIIQDGLIVPANTSGLEVLDAAAHTIPDITYITVGVSSKIRRV